MPARLVATVLVSALLACTPTPLRSSSSTTTNTTTSSVALGRNFRAQSPPQRCLLTVTETEGCSQEEIDALIETIRPRIDQCRGSSGGKVRIRIIHDPRGGFTFRVEPGSSLHPTERQCILDALATMNESGTSTGLTGLSIPPTGFTSLLTVEF